MIVAALIGGTVAAGADALLDGQATAGVSASPGAPRVVVNTGTSDTVAMAAQKATPSVVTLAVSSGTTRGIGSGIVLDAKGDILTNAHVVTLDGATGTPSIQVRSNDNHVYAGTLVGADPLADLAVIRIQAPSLVPAVLAESSKINVGDTAVAIGTPLGLSGTVTKGIVAALNRTISTAPPSAQSAPENPAKSAPQASGSSPSLEVIQTDAAINPGNSGGALVNARGEVIGVNVAIASPSTASAGAQAGNVGIGFAIPIDTAKRIAQEIIASGTATHGQLGIKATTDAAAKGSGFSRGATVTVVTAGSAAEKAGIRKDDVITAINNHPVLDTADLTAAVHEQPSGASVTVTLIRDGHEQSLSATLDPVQP
ncbi:hypothetical protein M707_08030 [Arthrobacter sp. AK-YN10]|nr:hypothetical protein M707_08030 [Arthrobacter sp. AK-YN10]